LYKNQTFDQFLWTGILIGISLVNMSDVKDSKPDSKFCILGVATKLFAKLGIDKCSTREIAKHSDVNVSLISYYFGGKEGLYKECIRNHALTILDSVKETVEEFDKQELTRELFIEDMSRMVDHMIQSQWHNPEMAKIIAREKLAGFPHARETHIEILYPLIQRFYRLFEAGQEKGIVKKEVSAPIFFMTLMEAICGIFNMKDCDLPLTRDCAHILNDPVALRKQLISIYLTGVLQ
jgi:AcrR family transcriptional regulator